jgi:hypothetical protein
VDLRQVVKNELEEITQDETRHNGVYSRTMFGSCEGEKRLTFFPSICLLKLMTLPGRAARLAFLPFSLLK